MKKISKFLFLLLLLILIVGCINKKVENPEKIKIGVIATTDLNQKSSIHWYDENLELIDVQKLKYAKLGGTYYRPIYDNNEVFIIPRGLMTKDDSQKVISLNTEDFNIEEFHVPNIALNNLAVTDEYIFVNSSLNYQTHLSRVDRKTKEFTEKIYDEAYFHSIITFENKLLLLGNMVNDETETFIYVLDEDFHILETIDISKYGTGGFKYLIDNKDLYLTIPYNVTESKENNILLKIDMDRYNVELIELENNVPDTIIKYKDKLFICHNYINTGYGNMLTVIDIKTEKQEVYDLKTDLDYVEVVGDNLVVVDQEKITLFDINDDFKLIKEVIIDLNKEHYISMVILVD